jgi:hypothetical protein
MVCPREVGNARIIAPNQFPEDDLGLPQSANYKQTNTQVALPGYVSTRAVEGLGLRARIQHHLGITRVGVE